MSDIKRITGRIGHTSDITGRIHDASSAKGSITMPEVEYVPAYTGAYTVTPTRETQILDTAGKKMAQAVTVNPIPSNYGLITWNGSVLTVS